MTHPVIDLTKNEATVDWLRYGRLGLLAAAGDQEAKAEMKRMEETPMVTIRSPK